MENLKALAYELREDTIDIDHGRQSRTYRRRYECYGDI